MQRTAYFMSIVMFWMLSAHVEGAPIVRDHRNSGPSKSPAGLIVRDHRGESNVIVRDHRHLNPVSGDNTPGVKFPPVKLPPVKLPPVKLPPVKFPPVKDPPIKLPPGKFPPIKLPPGKFPPIKLPPTDPPKCPVPPPCDPPTDGGCSKPCFPWGQFVGGFLPFGGVGGFGGSSDYVDNSVTVSQSEPVAEPVAEAPAAELLRLYPGMELAISGADFGADEGKVAIKVGDLIMLAEIVGWQADAVVVRLPVMLVARPLAAELIVKRADRTLAREVSFELAQGESQ